LATREETVKSRIRLILAMLVVTVLAVGPQAAAGQPTVTLYDSCLGVTHFPSDPIDGAPSIVGYYGSFGTRFAMGTSTFSYVGASGAQEGGGDIDSNGIGHGYGPLWMYGEHEMTGGTITHGDMTYPQDLGGLVFEIGDDEPECDGNDLSVFDDATTTTAEATTSTISEPPETSVSITDGGGNTYTAWWWTGGIFLVVGAGMQSSSSPEPKKKTASR
jgi:hypothetical protein